MEPVRPNKPPTPVQPLGNSADPKKSEIVIFDEKSIVLKSAFEVKEGYLALRKEYQNAK